jgi:predicted nucleotide-binding protein
MVNPDVTYIKTKIDRQLQVLTQRLGAKNIQGTQEEVAFFNRWRDVSMVVVRDAIGQHEATKFLEAVKPAPATVFFPFEMLSQTKSAVVHLQRLHDILEQFPDQMLYTEPAISLMKQRESDVPLAPPLSNVFIGHGRSAMWRELKELIVDRLGLQYEEFNRESAAGVGTSERLEEMLGRCGIAFLIFTAEDAHADGSKHARENVVHDAGLFQGRLGFRRAIVLLEEGCAEFSNIHGLGQIRFPAGKILAASEEIRKVLEREGALAPTKREAAKSA